MPNDDATVIELEDVSPADFETLLQLGFGEPDPQARDMIQEHVE